MARVGALRGYGPLLRGYSARGGQNTPRGVGYFVPKYAAAIPFLCLMFDEIW